MFPDDETYIALEKIFPINHTDRNLSNLDWAVDRFELAIPVHSADMIDQRKKVYRRILSALKSEQEKCQIVTDLALAYLSANGVIDQDIEPVKPRDER